MFSLNKKMPLTILVFASFFVAQETNSVCSWKAFFISTTNEKKKTLLLFMDTSYCSS